MGPTATNHDLDPSLAGVSCNATGLGSSCMRPLESELEGWLGDAPMGVAVTRPIGHLFAFRAISSAPNHSRSAADCTCSRRNLSRMTPRKVAVSVGLLVLYAQTGFDSPKYRFQRSVDSLRMSGESSTKTRDPAASNGLCVHLFRILPVSTVICKVARGREENEGSSSSGTCSSSGTSTSTSSSSSSSSSSCSSSSSSSSSQNADAGALSWIQWIESCPDSR